MPLSEAERSYHLRQYDKPYASTLALAKFAQRVMRIDCNGSAADVGCGAGANIHWLGDLLGINHWIGIELKEELCAFAQTRNPEAVIMKQDFAQPMPEVDYVFSIQILSFIESWGKPLQMLLQSTRRWCFISSLFWDGVTTHTHASDSGHRDAHYNIIDRGYFEHAARFDWGAKEVIWEEVPRASHMLHAPTQLRSRSEGGYVFSGPILMPWWFAAIRMGE